MKRRQYTYEQLRKVAKVIYKDKGFCTVIATALIAKVSFGKAYQAMQDNHRKHRQGAFLGSCTDAIKSLNCSINEVRDYYGKTFCQTLKLLSKDKIYLINTNGHVTCVLYGKVQDWVKTNSRKRVRIVYEVTRNF
jgi:hypothetical protein